MPTREIEGYDAILVRDAPRYRHNRKMVGAAQVPDNIRQALEYELRNPAPVVLQSPAEVQAAATQPPQEPGIQPVADEQPMTQADFDEPAPAPAGMPTQYEMDLAEQLEAARAQILENAGATPVQPLSAVGLTELANELYRRFGVYTVFTNQPPKPEDIHPFTADVMTRYEVGLAYQSYNRAVARGVLHQDFTQVRDQAQASAQASTAHAQEIENRIADPNYQAPAYKSFSERTSVEGQNKQQSSTTIAHNNDPFSEDPTAEPNLRGQTIRPQW